MSESYTTGGDSWQPLVGFDISAQTFTPLESHIVNFIDLNLWLWSYTPPWLELRECDSSHEPISPRLTLGHIVKPLIYLPPAKLRVRYQLDTPIALVKGTIYSFWIYKGLDHVGPNNQVLYDKDDATYPRGHIIFSSDGGNIWTHFPNHDFIFCEFGDPPLPKPEPPPPIFNFAIINITQAPIEGGIHIRIATSVPGHLTLYITEKNPLRHTTSRIERGLEVPWGAYFCFVAWHEAEQIELGDTLYHTFNITPWEYCQIKWVIVRGNIDNTLSASVGPIFKKHYNFRIFQHLNVPYSAYWGSTGPDSRVAQTFTPQQPQTIASIRLPLRRSGTPGTITVSIRATDLAGLPTGPDLTSGTTDGNTLPTTHPGEWRFFPLTPLRLEEYTKYAIVLRSQFASILWPHVGGNQYLLGQLCTYTVATDTWNPTGRDFIFECWATPEQ